MFTKIVRRPTRFGVSLSLACFFLCSVSLAFAQGAPSGAHPTFSKEVVRIFQARCQSCHHPGAPLVPMALTDYADVRPRVKAILKKVHAREMPPWHADSSVREYTNDLSMTDAEVDTIVRWAKARAPRGNPADMPAPLTFNDGWQIGEPDLILDTGADFAVAAEGPDEIKYFAAALPITEPKWLAAIEARPTDRAKGGVVRQIVVYVQNPEDGLAALAAPVPAAGSLGKGRLGFYAPGRTWQVFAPGEGKLLLRGARIIFQIHYKPNGVATADRSSVALKFHSAPAASSNKYVVTRGITETQFEIPPHAKAFSIRAGYKFSRAATILALWPEMHYRGSSMKFIAHYPGGETELLLHVDRYNYDWNVRYTPAQRIKVPAGTVLEVSAVMDNSHENIRNPEPHAIVVPGDATTQEKMAGWVEYVLE